MSPPQPRLGGPGAFSRRYEAGADGSTRECRWGARTRTARDSPLFVGLSFLGSATQRPVLVILSTSGFVALIPIAAGLAIGRFHLYGVDRLLSRTATYTLLTAGVLLVYLGGVVVIDLALRGLTSSGRSTASALVAALAVALAAPLRMRLQDAVDRRFSRRQYTALAVVWAHAQDRPPGTTLESVLQRALGDLAEPRGQGDAGRGSSPAQAGAGWRWRNRARRPRVGGAQSKQGRELAAVQCPADLVQLHIDATPHLCTNR